MKPIKLSIFKNSPSKVSFVNRSFKMSKVLFKYFMAVSTSSIGYIDASFFLGDSFAGGSSLSLAAIGEDKEQQAGTIPIEVYQLTKYF